MNASEKLKEFYRRVPVWKQLYYRWRALRGVPFRRKFFVGYDLDANTYWEFFLDRYQTKPRRMVQPYEPQKMLFSYFDKVPIQWAQWLKYARRTPPTIFDLIADQERIKKLQIMVNFRENEQLYNNQLKQEKIDSTLKKELSKLEASSHEKAQNAQNAAKIVQRSGFDAQENISHKEIKHASDAKLQTDAQKMENDDPWAAADAAQKDKPEKADIRPMRR